MLLKRVLTAAALLPPVIAAFLLLDDRWLALVLSLVVVLAAWEWSRLAGLGSQIGRLTYALVIGCCCAALTGVLAPRSSVGRLAEPWLFLSAAWWLMAPLVLGAYRPERPASAFLRLFAGVIVLPATVVALVAVRTTALGRIGVFVLFALVWAADIAAYFAGRALGRRKLAPQISPGKTWEGFAGGMLAALLVAAASGLWLLPPGVPIWAWIGLGGVVAAVSVVGDLFESLLKRIVGVKDSSNLLPGHGGVLDRIDSLLAAAPLFAVGARLIGV